MEKVLVQTKTISKEATKQMVVAISVTAAYMVLANLNPASAFVGIPALSFVASWRLPNLLRPLVLKYYGAAFGIAMGSYLFNVQSGKYAFGAYSVMPMIILGLSLFFWALSKKWGRSTVKDLTLIALYGASAGLVVSLNLISVAKLLDGTVWSQLLKQAVYMRVILHTLISLAGYPILKWVESKYESSSTK